MVYNHIYVDIKCQVNDNQATVNRNIEVRYRIRN